MSVETTAELPEIIFPSPREILLQRTVRHKGFIIGTAILALILAVALLALEAWRAWR